MEHHDPDPDVLLPVRFALLIIMLPGLLRVIISLLFAPWQRLMLQRKDRRLAKEQPGVEPMVSVIIPAWNEEVGVAHTVHSLLQSTWRNLEIIVVNDGSTDGTDDVMRLLLRRHARSGHLVPVRYLRKTKGGKSRAMNHGVSVAKGEVVMTIDADSVVDPHAVEHVAHRFLDPDVMCVCGNVKIGNHHTGLGLVQKLEYLMGFFHKKADSLLSGVYIVGGAAAAYRRSVFDTVGRFAEDIITEDIEMSTRIQDKGMVIEYEPRAIIYTEGPSELPGLMRQRLRWKHGRFLTFWRFRHLFFSTRPWHKKFLTWLVLPVAVLGDLVLLIQWALFTFTIAYAVVAHDYLPLLFYMTLMACIVVLQVLTDEKLRENLHLLWMAPATWLNVVIVDFIEFQAIVRSLWRLARGQDLKWQKWTRRGVFGPEQKALPG